MDQRIEFVLKAISTENFRGLCREYGVSPKTGYKWKQRFLQRGMEGMSELSRRPSGSPAALLEDTVCEIVRLKHAHPHWGPEKLRAVYARKHPSERAPSVSSFHRVLDRAGMVVRRKRRKAQQAGRIHSGRKAKAPNEVWTVDFKGWWRDPEGERCEPLTVRDEHSRYILCLETPPSGRTGDVRKSFQRLFERHGLPEAIRSDNGSPFACVKAPLGLSRLSAWWVVLGIDLERGRPGCPQDNGGHERMHRDIQRELAKAGCTTQESFDVWRDEFNHERPHQSLGNRTPSEFYQPSRNTYQGTPEDIDYSGQESRKVSSTGKLSIENDKIFISTALAGWSLGLTPGVGETTDIYFARLRLGYYDPVTASFHRAGTGPMEGANSHPKNQAKP